ncbi:heterokaryon incompatibility protein-domain-containing protein [Xylaria curta]|nr:heterokaryon incompatibility protein-domain-containing protein [Xylaria curta]
MPTAHSREELFSDHRIFGIVFGFIFVLCWCGYVWLADNGPLPAAVALFIFNSLFTLGYAPWGPYFLEFIFLTPFYIVKHLLTLFSKLLFRSCATTISTLELGLSFVLSTLSTVCVARLPRYRAPQANGDRELRPLCSKCRPIVDQSSLLKGTNWVFTWSREIYPFHSKNELQKSAKVCHLCSLLWNASFKNSSTCEADYSPIGAPSISTPLISTPVSTSQAQAKETMKLKMEILATRPFRQIESLHIRLLEKQGSDPLVSLKAEDRWLAGFTHPYKVNGKDFTDSEGCIEWAKNMLDKCERHEFCTDGFISSEDRRYCPKRLIDLVHAEEGVACLVLGETIGQIDYQLRYFALSHCWGGCVKSKLTVANSEQMETMEIAALDPNFRDAIAITLKMGVRYLWIDSLCIIQDSGEEWAEESGTMGLLYARAACVISATASINSNGGCFRLQDFSLYDCELLSHGNDRLVVCQKASPPEIFDEKVEGAVLTTRGWTFQERFLAKRVLHFCSGLVIFECNTLVASPAHEDVPYYNIYKEEKSIFSLEPPPQYNFIVRTEHPLGITRARGGRVRDGVKRITNPEYRKWTNSQPTGRKVWARLGMRGAFNFLVAFTGTGLREAAEFHVRWFDLVEPYSTRHLTKGSDKVIALLGVAQFIQQKTRFQFVAGLWDRVLPFNLLWTLHGPARDRPRDRVAPTWSWASVDGRISHRLRASDSVPSADYFLGVDKGIETTGSWESVESLISDVHIHAIQTVNGMITQATLTLWCSLSPFDKKNLNIKYDTLQQPLPHELLCLPILAFENRKIHPQTSLRQVHGILVRELGTREGGGDAPSRYERVGYFWTVQPSHGLYPTDEGSKQRIELV